MDNDLWISVRYISNLETFKVFFANDTHIIRASLAVGCEYNPQMHSLRRKIDIERKEVKIRGIKDLKELDALLETFQCKIFSDCNDSKIFIVQCLNEADAIKIALHLNSHGKWAFLENLDPFLYLLDRAHLFLKQLGFIPLFQPKQNPKIYSIEEIKQFHKSHTLKKPEEFSLHPLGIFLENPKKIITMS